MSFELSDRLKNLPPYLFVEIDKAKRKAKSQGRDIIDLGIGDPDEATPAEVVESLHKAAQDPKNQHYPLDEGIPELRKRIAQWYKTRFGVTLDADKEVLVLIGSKEGIAHLPLAFINPGDVSLIPDPCYPPYKGGTILSGGRVHTMPLLEENNFLPDLNAIKKNVLKKAKLLYINYPNNPTSAVCEKGFFEDVALFAKKHDLIVAHDAAYSEVAFDGYRPGSFLKVAGAMDAGVEFHSLSKTCNMTGWRIGFVCGNGRIVSAIAKVKSNIDSGAFNALQVAGITALDISEKHTERMNMIYQERRDALVDGLNKVGWPTRKPKATFYVWTRIPKKYKFSIECARVALEKADIVITPGIGMGRSGEGYVRMALTVSKERIQEAVERLKKVL
ncbi:MAG: LL-diaminopimelate aminotransferase [Candidatus Omnitrophica bacterium]|nr:LL-diaminopimelate aminotransferase [Candidatus Omnitrophota bacterium]MBU4590271.1 LL-diaminopimelate aminotransferase [Candidatus Omnitrophota bacterium]